MNMNMNIFHLPITWTCGVSCCSDPEMLRTKEFLVFVSWNVFTGCRVIQGFQQILTFIHLVDSHYKENELTCGLKKKVEFLYH